MKSRNRLNNKATVNQSYERKINKGLGKVTSPHNNTFDNGDSQALS